MIYFKCGLVLAVTLSVTFLAKYSIHMLQLEGYFLSQYRRHLFARLTKPSLLFHKTVAKKPIHYTARVKRLFAVLFLLTAALGGVLAFCLPQPFGYIGLALLLPLTSFLVMIALIITLPLEKMIAQWYIQDAKKRLKARPDLKIIGITGSYGKTSTKFILSTILSEKFAVLTPPSSYNTTMGVVRVIREQLQEEDELFICEMGARHKGDIAEICRIARPDMAIITSIGPQHLETFGSIEGVRDAKFELIAALPKDGIAIFPAGNPVVQQMFDKTTVNKYLIGMESKLRTEDFPKENASGTPAFLLRAQQLTVGTSGSAFVLCEQDGSEVECSTRLLGEHNIMNILLAAAAAMQLGMTLPEIARGISKLQSVEHRLQIVSSYPMTVIDDAFNSSPSGAKAALAVLKNFVGRRIIVTPGFVELGEKQDEYHFELGQQIAHSADIAILVGKKRTAAIAQGLQKEEFPQQNIYSVSSLAEATGIIGKLSVVGDVVLFENDLPDNFNE